MTTVVKTRRKGAENSETRAKLIQSAILILRDEGASAVTARRLAEQVGLGRHIVHYYFGTIDEVFVAIMREEGARAEAALREATRTGDAFDLLWQSARQSASIVLELTMLAVRHPSIAREYRIYTERYRQTMSEILASYAQSRGISLAVSPESAALLLQSVAYTNAVEQDLGLTLGHEQAEKMLIDWLKSVSRPQGQID